jgi:catechol 2,3-dioxygenase-like lactoylglutathione lyase family enzyme
MPESLRLAMVTLVVDDYDRAISHYTGDLGFRLVEDTDLGGGKRWVVVSPDSEGGVRLLLARAVASDQVAVIGRQAGGRVGFFLHTADMDATHTRLVAAGIGFIGSVRTEPYGRVVVFHDAYGNLWDLIEPAAER